MNWKRQKKIENLLRFLTIKVKKFDLETEYFNKSDDKETQKKNEEKKFKKKKFTK